MISRLTELEHCLLKIVCLQGVQICEPVRVADGILQTWNQVFQLLAEFLLKVELLRSNTSNAMYPITLKEK